MVKNRCFECVAKRIGEDKALLMEDEDPGSFVLCKKHLAEALGEGGTMTDLDYDDDEEGQDDEDG